MLRGLIAILILANLFALGAIRGLFGPLPASGTLDRKQLSRQIHPEGLIVRAIKPSESADVPIVGGPVADPAIQSTTLTQ
ncbi:hypothetical protein B0G62_101712 [Paraburkholderia eburnea]|uniref:Uncharacterized protein n=1 Tax=Paraburkholderia eburnea TaxID=1189126 RepID=A0A2S4MNI4_9BURK|nr:hypothetical protein [Paraburkholderia eburnea]POR56314.1 hypothetical protein B0G62_101712 [Paraburkholderia eburnea]PRZ27441.1 hypothetical protein BX588_101711 [Paraburkholderia eburnea]